MKKNRLFAVLLALTLALSCSLVACGGTEEEPPTPTPTTYTVTFDLNGAPGTAPAVQTIEEGKTVSKPTDPTWDDDDNSYEFVGWYLDAQCTSANKWNFDTNTVTSDITLYAGWVIRTICPPLTLYTVTFDLNGAPGTAPAMQPIIEGDIVAEPDNPTWDETHIFNGWYKEAACTNAWNFDTDTVENDITLYAKWTEEDSGQITPTPQTYTVTFNLKGAPGTAPVNQTINEGGKATEPTAPVWDEDHEFGGWFADEDCTEEWNFDSELTNDLILYAKWIDIYIPPTEYTVTFDLNGAPGTAPETQTIIEGEKAIAPSTPTRDDGYVFTDWYTDVECTTAYDFNTPVTEGITLYAGWKDARQTFTVTLHAGEGKFDNGQSIFVVEVKEGEELDPEELPLPQVLGCELDAWYIDAECKIMWDYDPITSNIDVYAKYIFTEYEIAFDANNGYFPSGVMALPIIKMHGESIDQSDMIDSPVKFAYDFTGWYIDKECTTKWNYEADVVTGNITFYAGWAKKADLGEYKEYAGTDGNDSSNLQSWLKNTPFSGIFDGEEVTFYVTGGDGYYDKMGKFIWTSHSKIECDGHVINIKRISGSSRIEAEIDGVEVTMSIRDSLDLGFFLIINRPGYDMIELNYMI